MSRVARLLLVLSMGLFPIWVSAQETCVGNGATCTSRPGSIYRSITDIDVSGKVHAANISIVNGVCNIVNDGNAPTDGKGDALPAIQACLNLGFPTLIPPPPGTQTLTANATTVVGSKVLNFASTSGIKVGMQVTDTTYSAHLLSSASVTVVSPTTVTLSSAVVNGNIVSGENLTFAMPYRVSAPIVLDNNAMLLGVARESSIIKLMDNACSDVVQTKGAYSQFAAVSNSASYQQSTGGNLVGVNYWEIRDLTIDGNKDNQLGCSNKDAVNGISAYGAGWRLSTVAIQNILGHGMRTEWGPFGETIHGTEPHVRALDILTTGRHGWWYKGPHDCDCSGVIVTDASQEADNTYDAIAQLGPFNSASGSWTNFHGDHYSEATNRVRFQFNSSGGNQFNGSTFEGGRGQYHLQFGASDSHSSSFTYGGQFQAAGTAMWVLDSTLSSCASCQWLGTAGNNLYAIQFGTVTNAAQWNTISSGIFINFDVVSPFNFLHDGGQNTIRASTGWTANGGGATNFAGTISGTTSIDYEQGGGTQIFNTFPWTPMLIGSTGGTATASLAFGTAEKDKRGVTVRFNIQATSVAGLTGNMQISQLPYTANATGNDVGICQVSYQSGVTLDAGYTTLNGLINPATQVIAFVESGPANATQNVPVGKFGNGSQVAGFCTYHQ